MSFSDSPQLSVSPLYQQSVLVYLANGVQGGAVVRQALRAGCRVRALVRDPRKAAALEAQGVELARADLDDAASLRAAHAGMDYVVLQLPAGSPERIAGLMANALAAMAGQPPRGLVVKMGNADPGIATQEPAMVCNRLIEAQLRDSGLPWAIVRPTMYLDNFLKPATRQAVAAEGLLSYPVAEQQRIAWTSTDDAARAALALLANGAFGSDCLVAGPEAVSGAGLAAAFAAALQRPVRFQSVPVAAFEAEVEQMMAAVAGPGIGRRIASKFHFLADNPAAAERMLAQAWQPQPALAGFVPTSVAAWVGERRALFLPA